MKKLAHLCVASALAWAIPSAVALDARSARECAAPCIATITVPGTSCGSGIHVTPDPIIIKQKGGFIEWTVATKDWKFAEKGEKTPAGIVINWAETEFPEDSKSATKFKVRDKNTKPGSYKYDINLIGPDGQLCSLDPTIMNY